MAIRKMFSNDLDTYPQGAHCPLEYKESKICVGDTHVGLCLFESERNGYDDSDFVMTVWDEEKQEPEVILFATTRAWSYPCFASSPDATDEVKQKYAEWKEKLDQKIQQEKRVERFKQLADRRKIEGKLFKKYSIQRGRLVMMRKTLHPSEYECVLNLMSNGRIRSKFKLSLRSQVEEWLKDEQPAHKTPLSHRQLSFLD